MRIALAVLLLLPIMQASPESGWRGIVPLHSKRSEVEKLFGPPSETLSNSVIYRTKNGTVMIFYSKGTPCGTKGSQWRVSPDTVIAIDVTLSPGHPLSKLNLDETKYTKKSGGHRPEDVYYVNEEKGEVLRVFNGEVLDIHYGPTSSDKDLKCPPLNQTENPPNSWRTLVPLQSNRADVEKLLGKPVSSRDPSLSTRLPKKNLL